MDARRIVTLGANCALNTALAALGAEVTAIRTNETEVSGVQLHVFASAETAPTLPRSALRTTVRNPLVDRWMHPQGPSEASPGTPFRPRVAVKELSASSTRMRFRTLGDPVFRMPTELVALAKGRMYEIEAEPGAEVNPEAVKAIGHAHGIVLGPGPFFSRVLATLAAPRIASALVRARAPIFFFANQSAEGVTTDGMALPCYVRSVREHVARWAGTELRQLTVVAHGERATWSAIDAQTRLRRLPILAPDGEPVWVSLAQNAIELSGGVGKPVSAPIEPHALYEPTKILARRP